MNTFAALLKTPWIASPRSSRWLALVVALLCATSAALAAHGLQGRDRVIICTVLWGGAIVVWWLLVAGNALFVARDAVMLRLPALQRLANASVFANALLTVLLPALVFTSVFGHPWFWLVGFSLAATCCMLFLLLPSWLTVAAIFGSSIGLNLLHPKVTSPQLLLELAIAPTLALIALAAWQWLRLQRRAAPATLGFNIPLIWSLHLQSIHGFGARQANLDAAMARASRSWLSPVPDLHALGPLQPVRSIRVALGRTVMPQTWRSVLRQIGLSLTFILVFTGLPIAAQMGNHDFRAVMDALILPHAGALGMPVMIACVIAAVAAATFPVPVRARWAAGAAELPLLGLLPGLGDLAAARRNVMRAALTQTLHVILVEFIVLCALGVWARALPGAIVFSALSATCTAALAAACILGVLGARPLSRLLQIVLGCVLLLLVGLAMACGFASDGFDARTWLPLVAALALLLALLLALCRRGWRAFSQRPHPFLASAP